jgi:prolyl oligopeptidase
MRRILVLLTALAALGAAAGGDEQYQWLEEVQGEKALAWAKEHNAKSTKVLEARPEYKAIYKRTLEILDSKEKIPMPRLLGDTVYNFWRDDAHERGIWRRTTLASYRTPAPQWETVLDIDALAKAEGKAWVFHGAECLPPADTRCMVSLSQGGSDASVEREFDTKTRDFVEDGFSLPEAKSRVAWRDEDTLWVGTDFGQGSLTTSGYPRIVKVWKRGTPVSAAKTVFEGKTEDVASGGQSEILSDGRYDIVTRVPAFFKQEAFLDLGDHLVKLDIPEDADIRVFFHGRLLFSLRSDWTPSSGGKTYREGSLLSAAVDDLLRGVRKFDVLFEPGERTSLATVDRTKDRVLLRTLDNVKSRITALSLDGDAWKKTEIPTPGVGTAYLSATSDQSETFFFTYEDFTTPDSLWVSENGGAPAKVKTMPAFFDATGVTTEQLEATSKDGTKIPYFVVRPKGTKTDGSAPTLLYGYGGFEISEVPTYNGVLGAAWLSRGGVYVLANIRGGGEFGPAWHKAAVREKHIHNFEDFAAVAQDLIARKITSPRRLGIMGGSQGGLLVSGTMVLYPELFHAVVAQVPLADMRRFNHLLAGASWMSEYGDPDKPEDWAFMQAWSPFQLLKADARYPTPFYWTNTRDDRVHPSHARKMVAKLEALGHPVYYFENTEGGHGSGAVNKQTAQVDALQYAYLWMMLK